jgi:hypothetical protein
VRVDGSVANEGKNGSYVSHERSLTTSYELHSCVEWNAREEGENVRRGVERPASVLKNAAQR